MRGKKARAVRREAALFPPDLREEMKGRIRALAERRTKKVTLANAERKAAEREALAICGQAKAEAWQEFGLARAEVVLEYERRAEQRRGLAVPA